MAVVDHLHPSFLAAHELKHHWLTRLHDTGALANVRATMRTALWHAMTHQQQQQQHMMTNTKNDAPSSSLFEKAINALVAEYLKSKKYAMTATVFAEEANVLDTHDAKHIIDAHKAWTLVEIVEKIKNHTHTQCMGTQTFDEKYIQGQSIDWKFKVIDDQMREKCLEEETAPTRTVQEKLIKMEREVNQRALAQIASEVERIRVVEIGKMRIEERARFKAELDAERKKIERVHEERIQSAKQRNEELAEQLRRKEASIESSRFEQRQKLLDELEHVRAREVEIRKTVELNQREQELSRSEWLEKNRLLDAKLAEVDALQTQLNDRIEREKDILTADFEHRMRLQLDTISDLSERLEKSESKVRMQATGLQDVSADKHKMLKDYYAALESVNRAEFRIAQLEVQLQQSQDLLSKTEEQSKLWKRDNDNFNARSGEIGSILTELSSTRAQLDEIRTERQKAETALVREYEERLRKEQAAAQKKLDLERIHYRQVVCEWETACQDLQSVVERLQTEQSHLHRQLDELQVRLRQQQRDSFDDKSDIIATPYIKQRQLSIVNTEKAAPDRIHPQQFQRTSGVGPTFCQVAPLKESHGKSSIPSYDSQAEREFFGRMQTLELLEAEERTLKQELSVVLSKPLSKERAASALVRKDNHWIQQGFNDSILSNKSSSTFLSVRPQQQATPMHQLPGIAISPPIAFQTQSNVHQTSAVSSCGSVMIHQQPADQRASLEISHSKLSSFEFTGAELPAPTDHVIQQSTNAQNTSSAGVETTMPSLPVLPTIASADTERNQRSKSHREDTKGEKHLSKHRDREDRRLNREQERRARERLKEEKRRHQEQRQTAESEATGQINHELEQQRHLDQSVRGESDRESYINKAEVVRKNQQAAHSQAVSDRQPLDERQRLDKQRRSDETEASSESQRDLQHHADRKRFKEPQKQQQAYEAKASKEAQQAVHEHEHQMQTQREHEEEQQRQQHNEAERQERELTEKLLISAVKTPIKSVNDLKNMPIVDLGSALSTLSSNSTKTVSHADFMGEQKAVESLQNQTSTQPASQVSAPGVISALSTDDEFQSIDESDT